MTTLVIIFALCVAAGWLGCAAWMWFRQQDLLYPNPGIQQGHDDHHPIGTSAHGVRAWIDNPGCERALLYFGGSGEAVEKRRRVLGEFFPGYTRYFLPHRGAGPNQGVRGNEQAIKGDAEALLALARASHTCVQVIGRSLGTSLALHLAGSQRLDGVALITPFGSLAEVAGRRYRWLPVQAMMRDKHEAWRDACHLQVPLLACLARHDRVTIGAHWERLARHLAQPATVHTAECDHETILEDGGTWQAIREWFDLSGRTTEDR